MSDPGSISRWLGELKAGNLDAAQPLWVRYFERMVALARNCLQAGPRAMADEEDVATSAFASFCRCMTADRFPRLDDRDDLWKILMSLTARKAADLIHHENRLKRGGAGLRGGRDIDWEEVIGSQPTPEFVVQVAEEYQRLLDRLGNDSLRTIALWKLEGYTTHEIAERIGCTGRTVERKLRVIRSIWIPDSEAPP